MYEISMQSCSHISQPTIGSLTYPATKIPIDCWPWISHEGQIALIRRIQESTEQLIHASCYNCIHFVSCVCLPVYIFLLGVNYSWVFLFVSSSDSRDWSRCKYEGNNRTHWSTSVTMVWKWKGRWERVDSGMRHITQEGTEGESTFHQQNFADKDHEML